MMGKTHALGGAAALAGYAMITGNADAIPIWGYAIAAGSALVPDADNGRGSLLNRWYLLPLKFLSIPLWGPGKPAHRTRTHSLISAAGWAVIMLLTFGFANFLLLATGAKFTLPFDGVVVASILGYLSHLALDMLNIEPIQLLWPMPIDVGFPPWRAHGFIPGRFHAGAWWWEGIMLWIPLVLFSLYFVGVHGVEVLAATRNHNTLADLLKHVVQLATSLISTGVANAMPR